MDALVGGLEINDNEGALASEFCRRRSSLHSSQTSILQVWQASTKAAAPSHCGSPLSHGLRVLGRWLKKNSFSTNSTMSMIFSVPSTHERKFFFSLPVNVGNKYARTRRAQLVAACTPDESELAWARIHLEPSGVKLYKEYHEMIKQAELEAVVIATVTSVHAEQAIKGIEAGLHVLCEKPLSTNVEVVSLPSLRELSLS